MAGSSLGYAKLLKHRADLGGQLGAPELRECDADMQVKVDKLVDLLRRAKHIVVFTGAGISTSAGIPDFRGPHGVWTRQRQGFEPPNASVQFSQARPSFTHMALVGLHKAGKLKYLCSQNVDCLHLRSGFPRHFLAELHGNCFAEQCSRCGLEIIRDFEVLSVGFKNTGRTCTKCGGAMRDQCLDWDDALPEQELSLTERHAAKADLVLCLGTSLQITPACDLPLRALRKQKHKPDGGSLAIINLQETPKDGKATVVIHAPVDEVMAKCMAALELSVPAYKRYDSLLISHTVRYELTGAEAKGILRIRLFSCHGKGCSMPWLESADVHFEHQTSPPPLCMSPPSWQVDIPLSKGWAPPSRQCVAVVKLFFASGSSVESDELRYAFHLDDSPRRLDSRRFEFLTCRVDYDYANKDVGEPSHGQTANGIKRKCAKIEKGGNIISRETF